MLRQNLNQTSTYPGKSRLILQISVCVYIAAHLNVHQYGRNFLACPHVEINSFRMFSVSNSGLHII